MEQERQNSAYSGSKVMTEEQIETLRKQIAIYTVICEQLLLLHNSLSPFPPLGGYFDPMVASSSTTHGISTRHRWTPTSMQLKILENIYSEGSGTPNPHRIREITKELSEHGQITEKNVYNWFQNRRARSKRKQPHKMTMTGQTDDNVAVTTEERSFGDSGGFESYEHILFPSPDLGKDLSEIFSNGHEEMKNMF